MTPSERVRRLVESGSVAPDEGARLLAAMSEAPARSRLWLLVDPFERFGGGTAAITGALISVLGLAVSRLGVRFDGFLDLHVDRSAVPSLHVALCDQLVAWLLPAVCFWAYARLFTRHVRLVDFVGMTGLARLPTLVSALVLVPLMPAPLPMPPEVTPALLAVALVAVVFGVANVTLLYFGFKNASGLTGVKLVGGFIGLLIGVEALSKVVLMFLT
ncbi:MAG: hypothetical protein BGO98_38880 [Myxococcales bacterium 68-20]|nr:hypothetical protein [Myxococcales bacterium]OJY26483.1 MAG: hypothetical protein BGO98_38880 [Myxococcales bacterium 68-20]